MPKAWIQSALRGEWIKNTYTGSGNLPRQIKEEGPIGKKSPRTIKKAGEAEDWQAVPTLHTRHTTSFRP